MRNHSFQMVNLDTDAISICYPDFKPITEAEQDKLLTEINSLLPPMIQMDHDGYYKCVVVIRTKNYITYDGKKIKIKGSGLKGSTKSPKMKQFINDIVDLLVLVEDRDDMNLKLQNLYKTYVKDVLTITDMKPYAARKTYTKALVTSTRKNETKVFDALKGSSYVEGDRFHVFYLPDESIKLVENFDGEYSKDHLLQNLWDTISIFDTVLPVKTLFCNYTLKKNKKLLEEL